MPKTLSIWDIYLNQLTRFKNKSAVSCLALWVNRRAMICEGYRYVTRLKCTRSCIIWRPPAMNISLVDVELTSIKQDGLSCVSPLLSLQALSRSVHSLAWVSPGPSSVFLVSVGRSKIIPQPQLVDDAIAGNSSPVMACTDDSGCTFRTACYFKAQ